MFRRILSALGLSRKPKPVEPQKKPAVLNRLQRQSALTNVSFEALKAKRRNQPPQ